MRLCFPIIVAYFAAANLPVWDGVAEPGVPRQGQKPLLLQIAPWQSPVVLLRDPARLAVGLGRNTFFRVTSAIAGYPLVTELLREESGGAQVF